MVGLFSELAPINRNMLGFKSFDSASITQSGVELVPMMVSANLTTSFLIISPVR